MVEEKITQCMKPHGEEGIQAIENMNENHRPISEFAFESINVGENDKILDIGCGGGVNIEKFLKLTANNADKYDVEEILDYLESYSWVTPPMPKYDRNSYTLIVKGELMPSGANGI